MSDRGMQRRTDTARRPAVRRDEEQEAHPLQLMQALVGNRGVGKLISPPAPVQRMDVATASYDVPRPAWLSKGDKDDDEESSDDEQNRKRRKEEKKEKKEKKKEKKSKKDKKSKKEKKEKKARKRSPSPDPRLRSNQRDLAELVTGSRDGFVWLSAPVRRHSLTEVTRNDIQGHNVFTTVTGDTLAVMQGYCDRINRGDFDKCAYVGRGQIEIDIDGRVFGCHDHKERAHDFLYPVAGPACTGMTQEELECMVLMRDANAETANIRQWYTADQRARARLALQRAGINIP